GVGCGPASITVDPAARVTPGEVVAIEPAAEPLEQARQTVRDGGVRNVTLRLGDVYALDDPDDSFDVVHAHQVLQHLGDPVGALREMLRVCTPDGVVAARDADYAATTWHPADSRLQRWLEIYRAVAHENGAEPDAGRRMLAWAHAAGAAEVRPSASVWCYATTEQRAEWGHMWADRIVESDIAGQAVEGGHADHAERSEIATGWRTWA